MNKLLLAAVSTLALSSVATMASAHDMAVPEGKEKCYGISKAGANDCAAKDGSHSCAGQAKEDKSPNEFVLVDKGSCETVGNGSKAPVSKTTEHGKKVHSKE